MRWWQKWLSTITSILDKLPVWIWRERSWGTPIQGGFHACEIVEDWELLAYKILVLGSSVQEDFLNCYAITMPTIPEIHSSICRCSGWVCHTFHCHHGKLFTWRSLCFQNGSWRQYDKQVGRSQPALNSNFFFFQEYLQRAGGCALLMKMKTCLSVVFEV